MLFDLLRSCRLFRKVDRLKAADSGEIYVNLMGGLGNQLFQYAFAQYLARHNLNVAALVLNYFDRDPYNRTPLIGAMSTIPVVRIPAERLHALRMLRDEDGHAIVAALMSADHTDSLCVGYWQDPFYAQEARQVVSADLLAHYDAKYRDTSTPGRECVVHVRRTDYGHHGLLPLSYYLACLEESGWPDFSVITDEPNFCEYVFSQVKGFSGVIRGKSGDPWTDFYFMFRARTQIIANSSFSWWTAWFGRSAGTTTKVFAPDEWSLTSALQPCPGEWSRMDTKLLRP